MSVYARASTEMTVHIARKLKQKPASKSYALS